MPTTVLHTSDGRLDPADEASIRALSTRLAARPCKILLHLHGGLVDQKTGEATAARLSGNGPDGYCAPADYEQIFVVWRTGLLETIRNNWKELADDKLYESLLTKLIDFLSRKLPSNQAGRSAGAAIGLTYAEIKKRLQSEGGAPFADVDAAIDAGGTAGRSAATGAISEQALRSEFELDLQRDRDFNDAVRDMEAAVQPVAGGRAAGVGPGDPLAGLRSLQLLDEEERAAIEAEGTAAAGSRALLSGALVLKLVRHGGSIALRVFRRFRTDRDHGFHATIVEELLRELYMERVGAPLWHMMKKDGADHFLAGGLGSRLLAAFTQGPKHHIVVVGHSAGSIWASELLRSAVTAPASFQFHLVFLAPAVRTILFADAIDKSAQRISSFRMFAMGDDLERNDAVLGHRFGFLYPSSLLYLVSGLFEQTNGKAAPDASLLGMQRFFPNGGTPGWLKEPDELAAHAAVATFLAGHTDSALYSKVNNGAGLRCESVSHGGFDNEEHTLKSIAALF